jgi:hypothetical protein
MLRALIALAFLEGCIPVAFVLINRTLPFDAFIGALTSNPAFGGIVLPDISAADNSAFDPKAHRDHTACEIFSVTWRASLACDDRFRLLRKDSAFC